MRFILISVGVDQKLNLRYLIYLSMKCPSLQPTNLMVKNYPSHCAQININNLTTKNRKHIFIHTCTSLVKDNTVDTYNNKKTYCVQLIVILLLYTQ